MTINRDSHGDFGRFDERRASSWKEEKVFVLPLLVLNCGWGMCTLNFLPGELILLKR